MPHYKEFTMTDTYVYFLHYLEEFSKRPFEQLSSLLFNIFYIISGKICQAQEHISALLQAISNDTLQRKEGS